MKDLSIEEKQLPCQQTVTLAGHEIEELKTYFPLEVLNNEEIEHCQKLSKNGYIHVVKYLRDAHPEMGLKEAKIYYDLYFDN